MSVYQPRGGSQASTAERRDVWTREHSTSDASLGDLARGEPLPAGPSPAAAGPLIRRCAEALRSVGVEPDRAAGAWWVPGRIEVLGKHTDYLGGRSLLAAADRGLCFVAAPRAESEVLVVAAASGETRRFPLRPDAAGAGGHWSGYAAATVRRLATNFGGSCGGAAVAFAGDLPPAAGMSSSSALVTGLVLAIAWAGGLRDRAEWTRWIGGRERLAGYAAAVESGADFGGLPGGAGVGTHGGSEDHTAILCGRADHLVQYSFVPVRWEREIAIPEGLRFAVAVSGVTAEKTGSAMESYNQVARLGRRVLELWRERTGIHSPSLAAAAASAPDAPQLLRRLADDASEDPALRDRLEQFLAESTELIPAAGDALARGSLDEFGDLVDRSQALADRLLGNQVPETRYLASSARALGAVAASAFGAGFGGSIWALVHEEQAEALVSRWEAAYREAFPARTAAHFLISGAGSPARRLA